MDKYYGYFSRRAYLQRGYTEYETPEGKRVIVTLATKESDLEEVKKFYLWDDVVFVGEVTVFCGAFKRVCKIVDQCPLRRRT